MKALTSIQGNITAGGTATGTAARSLGVAVTGGATVSTSAATAPTAGQVLTATGASTATWQTLTEL